VPLLGSWWSERSVWYLDSDLVLITPWGRRSFPPPDF
jgi:hypothetical protein